MFGNETNNRLIGMITYSESKPTLAEQTICKAGFKIDKFFKINNNVLKQRYNK
jgi:hypothetical protein